MASVDRQMALSICTAALKWIRETNPDEPSSVLQLDIPKLIKWYKTLQHEHLSTIFDDDIGIQAALAYDDFFMKVVTSDNNIFESLKKVR